MEEVANGRAGVPVSRKPTWVMAPMSPIRRTALTMSAELAVLARFSRASRPMPLMLIALAIASHVVISLPNDNGKCTVPPRSLTR